MSTINNALSKLAEQESSSTLDANESSLVRAKIAPVKSSRLAWAIGGFTLSLGIGAWAVSSAPNPIQTSLPSQPQMKPVGLTADVDPSQPSITTKVVEPKHTKVYEAVNKPVKAEPKLAQVTTNRHQASKVKQAEQVKANQMTAKPSKSSASLTKSQPASDGILLASNTTQPSSSQVVEASSMQVQKVELTHRQMADKAIDRANKALDSNDFASATDEFKTALRYVPEDEKTRRKLAALYYGNRQVRKSAELLEEGIRLNKNSTDLRMSLASILLKEDQAEAALNTLGYIPDNVTDKYLAMRAALAQKLKKNDWAQQSYQMLTQRDPDNGRWWLGLGIQQERNSELKAAKESYSKALTMVGLSSQSQSFIRDRIAVLTSLEQGTD